MHNGWYQVAYTRDLGEELMPVSVAGTEIALLRRPDGTLNAISAHCPHRGANLCVGGSFEGDRIICAFHAFPVHLDDAGRFRAAHFDVLEVSGLIFVRKKNGPQSSFADKLRELARDHYVVPGFALTLAAPAEMVIENAFDQSHFRPVHNVKNDARFELADTDCSSYGVTGVFQLPVSQWQTSAKTTGSIGVPFLAQAYSPTIVLSRMGGDKPYYMITTTQPSGPAETIARLSLIMPPQDGKRPNQDDCAYLLKQARGGLLQDAKIWASMARPEIFDPVDTDNFVVGFREFCARFDADAGAA